MSNELIIIEYLIVAVIVAKLLFYYEKWDRKRKGFYNWDDVDPTIDILLGIVWPMTLATLVFIGGLWIFISFIRLIFFRS